MPRFFFHLVRAGTVSRDEDGIEFASFEDAFIDAHRAAVDMTCDMVRNSVDPRRVRFDVRDDAGRTVFELPFSEVMRSVPVMKPVGRSLLMTRIEESFKKNRELKQEIASHIAAAAKTMQQIRVNLDRAQTSLRGSEGV